MHRQPLDDLPQETALRDPMHTRHPIDRALTMHHAMIATVVQYPTEIGRVQKTIDPEKATCPKKPVFECRDAAGPEHGIADAL